MNVRMFFRFVFFLLFTLNSVYASAEKVVLQLKWEHEFQFAGYYAALWQGYYAEEGLNVEIRPASRPDGTLVSPVDELLAGRADYAIGALDILIERDRGADLVILAPIFQSSPNTIFTLPSTPLKTIDDLTRLRIATPEDDFTRAEVMALFSAQGADLSQIQFIDRSPTVETLLRGEADAIATYSVSARTEAKERGVTLNELHPKDFGLDFYGDTLYTHQRMIERDPEQVERFLRATLRGWDYAVNNKVEVAQRIAQELPRHLFTYRDFVGYNLAFADAVDGFLGYPLTDIGHSSNLRWEAMSARLQEIGVIQQPLKVDDLIFSQSEEFAGAGVVFMWLTGFGVLLAFSLYFFSSKRYLWVLYLLSVGVILYVEQALEEELLDKHRSELAGDVRQQLEVVTDRIYGVVNRNLAYVSSMAAYISANPGLPRQQFDNYARAIFKQPALLQNIAAAPGLVVKYVYPFEPNKAVIGLDYRTTRDQEPVVMRIADSNKLAVAGPLVLVQGGTAFIARAGIMVGDDTVGEHFWGILSAPIMADSLYRAVGLYDPELAIDIAVRGKDARGATGEVFFGDASLFSSEGAVTRIVRVGDGSWQLAAVPKAGWGYSGNGILMIRGISFGMALLILLFLVWRGRQNAETELYQQQIRDNEMLLREVSRLALINGWKIPVGKKELHWSLDTGNLIGLGGQKAYPLETVLAVFGEREAQELRRGLQRACDEGRDFDIELEWLTDSGSPHWVRWIGKATGSHADGYEVTGAVQDITERKKTLLVLEQQANDDPLTGLSNRTAFYNSLRWAVADARRKQTRLAVLFIDLDKFKPVNDSFGHETGDELLKQVAGRIRRVLRATDTVARISGDEFTVIAPEINSEYAPLDIAEGILRALSAPYDVRGRQIYCGASIGISVYPEDTTVAEDLVSKADYAMYEVKKSGRNGCKYFTRTMQERSEERHTMYNSLKDAINNERLTVVYQPIIDLSSGVVAKCEALVRWHDASGKMVPTQEFIALAEETNLVNDIDLFVLKQAGAVIGGLKRSDGTPMALTVNLSPRLFTSSEVAQQAWLNRACQLAANIPLTVEITERLLVEEPERVMSTLQQLKSCGATIAIDDFGTGYSSLSYLTRLPIDYIKIDRAFVQSAENSVQDRMLVDTIISLAKNLNLELIGEGVETDSQLAMLKIKGCEYAQGFLLHKPMSEDALRLLVTAAD